MWIELQMLIALQQELLGLILWISTALLSI
jgi:hypothetical protein